MKKIITWSEWSIATKILVTFLGLSVISMSIVGYMAITNIRELGRHALVTSTSLGESAIKDSTTHLVQLGEDIVTQVAKDVAKQVEMYLSTQPEMTLEEMRNDSKLREITVQQVGLTGYTLLVDSNNYIIIIHRYEEQEKELSPLKDILPSFWTLVNASSGGKISAGYYDWQEVDHSIQQKYASIVPVRTLYGRALTVWATTYISEFSLPVNQTQKEISTAILKSSNYINSSVSNMENFFVIIFTALIIIVTALGLLISWVITNPVHALQYGAEAIGKGNLDYKIKVKTRDELGDLANSFNNMSTALRVYTDELKSAGDENVLKERKIQDNLRLYAQKVITAQEAERKRIARELHDETAQALIVVSRHLDDLTSGESGLTINEIRDEVRKILNGVRKFSQELRPSVLDDLGLIPAIQWLASDLSKNYNIKVETKIIGDSCPLSAEADLMLFRIIQESLTNVRRHSNATTASVILQFGTNSIVATVQDNGKGFEMPEIAVDLVATGKLGLAGIEERVQLLGGTLNIESQHGKGTTITVQVPLEISLD